jgi:hypothetical protein
MIDDVVVGFKNVVGEPIIPHELPDVFDRIKFWAFGWQWDDANILGYDERRGHMPPGLIHEHDRMGFGLHGSSDFCEMKVHRVGIAERQDKACALAKCGADCTKNVG